MAPPWTEGSVLSYLSVNYTTMTDSNHRAESKSSHSMNKSPAEDEESQTRRDDHSTDPRGTSDRSSIVASGGKSEPPPSGALPTQGMQFQRFASVQPPFLENSLASTTPYYNVARLPHQQQQQQSPNAFPYSHDGVIGQLGHPYVSSPRFLFLEQPLAASNSFTPLQEPISTQRLLPDPFLTMATLEVLNMTNTPHTVANGHVASTTAGFNPHALIDRSAYYRHLPYHQVTGRSQQHQPLMGGTIMNPLYFSPPNVSMPSSMMAPPVASGNASHGTCAMESSARPSSGDVRRPSDKTLPIPPSSSPSENHSVNGAEGLFPVMMSPMLLLPQDEISFADTVTTSTQVLPISMQLDKPAMVDDDNRRHTIPHYAVRKIARLAMDEDVNWLSEYLCFARSDLLEVFQANPLLDSEYSNCSRNVVKGQIGIRCTYCAHIPHSKRDSARSYSFPSSLGNIYQNVAVMLHDHFGDCKHVPENVKNTLHSLKNKKSKGSANVCREYWQSSAKKLGLVDQGSGIFVASSTAVTKVPKSGTGEGKKRKWHTLDGESSPKCHPTKMPPVVMLVTMEDRELTSDFYFALMTRLQLVHLEDSERTGGSGTQNKNLKVGYAGIGCRYCFQKNRGGMCRRFPLSRRVLPNNIDYLYEHIRRCTLIPLKVKQSLAYLKSSSTHSVTATSTTTARGTETTNPRTVETPAGVGKRKEFFDQIWKRMKDSEYHQQQQNEP